jgi:hypothetical protein
MWLQQQHKLQQQHAFIKTSSNVSILTLAFSSGISRQPPINPRKSRSSSCAVS